MEVPNSVLKYGSIALLILMVVGAIFAAITKNNYDNEMARLRNEVAGRDVTIEVQKGVFTKLSLETEDLRSALNSKDQQVQDLLTQVKKNKEDLLAANQLVLKWKKAYEGIADAHQEEVPPTDTTPARKKVTFVKDFGAYKVSGFTLTDPAEAQVKLEQLKALALTLVISQDANKAWHAYATSSDDNTSVEISVSAVNPYMLDPKWYEKIEFNATVAGGQSGLGFGVLAGIGVSYKIKQFNIGPAFFLGIGNSVDKYFGATVAWRPFER